MIISQNIKGRLELPKETIIRVNMAWMKNMKELEDVLTSNRDFDVFLDYPQGRTKPPKPTLKIEDAFYCIEKYPNIRYFAISNVESPDEFKKLKEKLPNVILVPKIETVKGVDNLVDIIKSGKTDMVMLDKEDLYVDVQRDTDKFEFLVNKTRVECWALGVRLLELEGVIFDEHKFVGRPK